MTGFNVCEAMTPGSAALNPAPATITSKSFLRMIACRASGVLCAEQILSLVAIPLDFNPCTNGLKTGASLSDPKTISTFIELNYCLIMFKNVVHVIHTYHGKSALHGLRCRLGACRALNPPSESTATAS